MRQDEVVITLNLEVLQNSLSLFHFLEEPGIFILVTPVCFEGRAGIPTLFLVLLPLPSLELFKVQNLYIICM